MFVLIGTLALCTAGAGEARAPGDEAKSSEKRSAPEIAVTPEAHPDLLLVGYRKGVSRSTRKALHAAAGAQLVHSFRRVPVDVVRVAGKGRRDAAMAACRKQAAVRYVEPNYRLRKTRLPDDPRFGELWGLHNTGQDGGTPGADIRVTNVWATLGTGSTGVLVAVIDTGMDYTHEDLAANVWANPDETANGVDDDGNGIVDDLHGACWLNGDGTPTSGDPMDGDGHGTHVAGTIGAVGNNGVGVAGVNWTVRLMALKFLDDSGSGWEADAIAAIEYAMEKGARLSNNSWGGGGHSQALKDAIAAAGAAGQLFIAAAGNSGTDNDVTPFYPASFTNENLVAVASSDRNDARSSFSCYGRVGVDLAAPGSDILSSVPGDAYDVYSGTSMATPHVAGAAVLLWSLHPGASFQDVKAWLMEGATRLAAWSGLTVTAGRLNVGESARIAALPPGVAPVADFAAASGLGETNVFLSWVNPTHETFDQVIVRRGGAQYPARWDEGVAVYSGSEQAVVDGPFNKGEVYYYAAWAVFTNGPDFWYSAPRYARCRVGGEPDDWFTELFSASDNDLAWTTVTFVPAGTVNRYRAFADEAEGFPTDPTGGTPIPLGDDTYQELVLADGQTVSLYDVVASNFFVGANGYITFGAGDTRWGESLAAHFSVPRIAGLFDDLNPAAGGRVSWRQLSDRVAVTWEAVPEYGTGNENSFQVELFFDGTIRITWLALAARDGLAGLSAGEGIPPGFVESDLTGYPSRDDLRVMPKAGLTSSGVEGGPFSPTGVTYAVTNMGTNSLSWTVSTTSSWISINTGGGILAAGGSTSVVVGLDESATSLGSGVYAGRVIFSNLLSGRVQSRPVSLTITRPGMTALYYADAFAGANYVLPALRNLGYAVTVAASWSEFNQQLQTNPPVLAVALNQAYALNADPVIVEAYIGGGGKVLLVDWTADEPFGNLFQAEYTGADDQTPVYLTEDYLTPGVANPLPLEDPGWGTLWALGLRPRAGGESLGQFPNDDAALVLGNGGHSVLLGFMADTLRAQDGTRFFENLFRLLETGGDAMKVRPFGSWTASGYELGPFSPTSGTYTVTNAGAAELEWSATVSSNWVSVADGGGTLAAGATSPVAFNLTPEAEMLLPGQYRDFLVISNLTSGWKIRRELILNVIPRPGEIHVFDSVSPTNDLSISFGKCLAGTSRVEQIILHNADSQYNLIVTGVAVLNTPAMKSLPAPKHPRASAVEPAALDPLAAEHVPDMLLVGFSRKGAAARRDAVHAAVGARRLHRYRHIAADVVELPKGTDVRSAIAAYRAQPGVAYAEPNYLYRALLEPNDPRYGELWGLHNTGQTGGTPGADIRAPQAWDITTGSTQILVAVIDTGIDYTHPDLAANLWINPGETANGLDDDGNGIVDDLHGARWTGGSGLPTSGDPMDGHSHGTHVAGTIGAVGHNGIGVAGVNWRVRLMALKFLNDSGSGSTADAIAAIEYAIEKGARLSNNSWGGGGYSRALQDAIAAAGTANQLFVAAAGNDAADNDVTPHYPSSYTNDNIVAVASSDNNDQRSSFSSYGRTSVDLAAPGSAILSTILGSAYGLKSGTSMATPHVTGAAALMLSVHPSAPWALVKQALLESVDIRPAWTNRTVSGGRLNAAAALQMMNPNFRLEGLGAFPWLIPPGSSYVFEVVYRPLEIGVHTGVVRIISNDTNTPAVDVSVSGMAVEDTLRVSPGDRFVSVGPAGGPFLPTNTTYTLTNSGLEAFTWTASVNSAWCLVSPAGSELPPGGTAPVEVSITALADTLARGVYPGALVISNQWAEVAKTRDLVLVVGLCDAMEACDLPWATGGDALWEYQTVVSQDGEDAAQSGTILHDQESWMETVVNGPGDISFWWKVSSEAGYDFLEFSEDLDVRDAISGEVGWQYKTFEVGTGPRVLRWRYWKDELGDGGSDAGWVDRVVFSGLGLEDASDHAGNYSASLSNFVDGANGGSGFLPWAITLEAGATAQLDNSANGTGNINSTNHVAFRFYGGPGSTYVNAVRPFAVPLRTGDAFRVTLAYNWNGGARGMCLLNVYSEELMNVNFGPGDTLSFKWGHWPTSTVLSTAWSPTTILCVAVTQLGDGELRADLVRSDGYATNFTSSGLGGRVAAVKFYNGGHPANDVRYALYVNDLVLQRLTDGIPNWWWERYGIPREERIARDDTDGDGFTFNEEYIADTDPTRNDSHLPPAALGEVSEEGTMTLVVDPTSTARLYRVEGATNLLAPLWIWIPPEKPGTGAAVLFLVTNEVPARVYRFGVRLP